MEKLRLVSNGSRIKLAGSHSQKRSLEFNNGEGPTLLLACEMGSKQKAEFIQKHHRLNKAQKLIQDLEMLGLVANPPFGGP